MSSSSVIHGSAIVPHKSYRDTDACRYGFRIQHDILVALRDAGQSPPVLDARLLLEDPSSVLCQLCERLGLRFEDSMLSWEAGGNPADGVWAPYWYQNVHRSTGFAPYRPKSEPFPAELEAVFGNVRGIMRYCVRKQFVRHKNVGWVERC